MSEIKARGPDNKLFTAKLRTFRNDTEEKLRVITLQSAQDVVADAQLPMANGGRMPVDTGFLRNSLMIQVGRDTPGLPPSRGHGLNRDTRMAAAPVDPVGIAKIGMVELGDTITATWTAHYARHVEYGARGPARFFVRGAVEKWQAIVRANVRRLLRR